MGVSTDSGPPKEKMGRGEEMGSVRGRDGYLRYMTLDTPNMFIKVNDSFRYTSYHFISFLFTLLGSFIHSAELSFASYDLIPDRWIFLF